MTTRSKANAQPKNSTMSHSMTTCSHARRRALSAAATKVFALPELRNLIMHTYAGCRTPSATALITMTDADAGARKWMYELLPARARVSLDATEASEYIDLARSLTSLLSYWRRDRCDQRESTWMKPTHDRDVHLSLADMVRGPSVCATPRFRPRRPVTGKGGGYWQTTRKNDIQRTLTTLGIPWKKSWTKPRLVRAYFTFPDAD